MLRSIRHCIQRSGRSLLDGRAGFASQASEITVEVCLCVLVNRFVLVVDG